MLSSKSITDKSVRFYYANITVITNKNKKGNFLYFKRNLSLIATSKSVGLQGGYAT